MTQSPSTSSSSSSSSSSIAGASGTSGALSPAAPSELQTSQGRTTVADGVVQKIAGLAAREVSGVYALGGGAARAFGAIRERIPGATQSVGQGVSVEVGEKQAAVDLDLVTEYGAPIAEIARSVRRNVIASVETMTGLEVTEVNISVNDIHLPTDDEGSQEPSRVQ
ncbi:Asp23/Gls24 family envelope stress response protein [Geodermatophilus nigrescens]